MLSASPAEVDVGKEKQRLQSLPPHSNGSVFPLMNFSFPGFPMRNFPSSPASATPASLASLPTTTCGNGVFPSNLPFLSQGFPLHQLMLMQHWSAKQGTALLHDSNGSLPTDSRASSTSASSPSSRSLERDDDGNSICPICKERLGPETDWESHLRIERSNLILILEGIQSRKFQAKDSKSSISDEVQSGSKKRNRVEDLKRIQENQRKRLTVNKGIHIGVNRDAKISLSDDFNGQNSSSPFSRDNDQCSVCKTCQQQYDHYIVDSRNLDELRCEKCFREYRRQLCALPLTITGSPDEEDSFLDETEADKRSNHFEDEYDVPTKRIKTEVK
uniref:Uncharacterized protein n=1 Tax=Acrobeloides nanus TaxID=290746 RepID=A0A914DKR8_9BILA